MSWKNHTRSTWAMSLASVIVLYVCLSGHNLGQGILIESGSRDYKGTFVKSKLQPTIQFLFCETHRLNHIYPEKIGGVNFGILTVHMQLVFNSLN